jgi:hypothetical protein
MFLVRGSFCTASFAGGDGDSYFDRLQVQILLGNHREVVPRSRKAMAPASERLELLPQIPRREIMF